MRHILVLQWRGTTGADFEALIDVEDALESRLGESGTVDGHDFGSGEMNIFIETEQPLEAFMTAREVLSDRPGWADVRAASRAVGGDTYDVIWPPGLLDFSVK
jgi:hypothetical protein